MKRLSGLTIVFTAGLSVAAIAASAAPQPERLRGIVTAVSANEVTVHTATGDVSMSVSGDTKYLTTVHADVNKHHGRQLCRCGDQGLLVASRWRSTSLSSRRR